MIRPAKSLLAALWWIATAAPAWAQSHGVVQPVGYCQLTVTSSAVQTSTCSGFKAGATYAVVTNEGAAARWRDDGTAPTTTVGNPFPAGTATAPSSMSITTTLSALQWISQGGTTVLNFALYR